MLDRKTKAQNKALRAKKAEKEKAEKQEKEKSSASGTAGDGKRKSEYYQVTMLTPEFGIMSKCLGYISANIFRYS